MAELPSEWSPVERRMLDDARQGRRERPYQVDMGATEDAASRRPGPHIDMAAHFEGSSEATQKAAP
jgi:hypothetical protein